MPVVPDIDVHRLGRLCDQHDEVDEQADRQYDRRNRGSPCKTCRTWPADIDDREINAEAHDHRLCGRAEIIDEQRNDKTNADEADADGKT